MHGSLTRTVLPESQAACAKRSDLRDPSLLPSLAGKGRKDRYCRKPQISLDVELVPRHDEGSGEIWRYIAPCPWTILALSWACSTISVSARSLTEPLNKIQKRRRDCGPRRQSAGPQRPRLCELTTLPGTAGFLGETGVATLCTRVDRR